MWGCGLVNCVHDEWDRQRHYIIYTYLLKLVHNSVCSDRLTLDHLYVAFIRIFISYTAIAIINNTNNKNDQYIDNIIYVWHIIIVYRENKRWNDGDKEKWIVNRTNSKS